MGAFFLIGLGIGREEGKDKHGSCFMRMAIRLIRDSKFYIAIIDSGIQIVCSKIISILNRQQFL